MKKNLAYDAYEELADLYASLVDTKPHNEIGRASCRERV